MPDNKADSLGKEKLDMAEELLDVKQKVLKTKLIAREFGIDDQTAAAAAGLATKGREPDTLQAGVVGAVLTAMTGMNSALKETAETKEKEIKEARASEDTAKQNFFQLQADAINAARKEMTTLMQDIMAKNTPQAAIAGFRDFKAFFDEVAPKPVAPSDGGERAARMVDNQTALKLEEMHQNHALAMKKIDLEISQQQNAFQLQLTQFKEDSERRWQEYRDSKTLRSDALGGFQDLAAAIAAGIDKERGVGAKAGDEPASPRLEATLKQFRCNLCQTVVNVDDPEAASVACPNPECGTVFHLRQKAG